MVVYVQVRSIIFIVKCVTVTGFFIAYAALSLMEKHDFYCSVFP
jgi:hypothetical protein